MKFKLLALRRFNDGNAYPKALEKGDEVVVDEVTKNQMLRSDPDGFQVLGKVVPESSVKKVEDDIPETPKPTVKNKGGRPRKAAK